MPKPKLLDQVCDAIQVKRYRKKTEGAYVHGIKHELRLACPFCVTTE
jgi:hypothetical protein